MTKETVLKEFNKAFPNLTSSDIKSQHIYIAICNFWSQKLSQQRQELKEEVEKMIKVPDQPTVVMGIIMKDFLSLGYNAGLKDVLDILSKEDTNV